MNELIELFSLFYCIDEFSLNDLKNAHHLQVFHSHAVKIQNYTFYLELWPNGCNDTNKGITVIFLCLASRNPTLKKLRVKYKLIIKEKNINLTKYDWFNPIDRYYSGQNFNNKFTFDELKKLNKITITFNIEIITIVYNDDVPINERKPAAFFDKIPKLLNLPITKYKWKINDKKTIYDIKNVSNTFSVASPVFESQGIYWYIG